MGANIGCLAGDISGPSLKHLGDRPHEATAEWFGRRYLRPFIEADALDNIGRDHPVGLAGDISGPSLKPLCQPPGVMQ